MANSQEGLSQIEQEWSAVQDTQGRVIEPPVRRFWNRHQSNLCRSRQDAKLLHMAELLAPSSLMAFVALTALEIVLGVDNLVFIAILSGRLPPEQRGKARRLGLAMAAIGRIVLLMAASWVITLEKWTLPSIAGFELSVRDVILIAGGAFLLAKATWEIHESLEGVAHHRTADGGPAVSMASIIWQILLLDLVFSIDSVLTAVAMVEPGNTAKFTSAPIPFTTVPWPAMALMSTAVLVAVGVMLWFVNPVSSFIERHPTVKMLALAFLILIGMVLVADGFHQHIPRGYIYFAMGFSIFVEMLNIRAQARRAKLAK
jgi:predicted tellurium resistance membrane protein TerC